MRLGNKLLNAMSKLGLAKKAVSYNGNYNTFVDAQNKIEKSKHGGGYGSDAIFKKVSESTLAVVRGEAAFERDSFLFHRKETNYNLMMYLYRWFIHDGRLDVLDFGGALGSTYLQHRKELEAIGANWNVTEQEHFVDFGKKNVTAGNLHFVRSDELEGMWGGFNAVLFSSVLQYIEDVESLVGDICSKRIRHIIIERTPVSDCSWYWIETVHEPIYEAVYPCRVFDEGAFVRLFTDEGYELADSWHSLVDGDEHGAGNRTVQFKSFVFELK